MGGGSPKTKLQSDTSMQPTMESTTVDRPAQCQQTQRIRSEGRENITEQDERGGRKTERDKEGEWVRGERERDAETVELADCEKPESPCRLFRVFLSAIMGH